MRVAADGYRYAVFFTQREVGQLVLVAILPQTGIPVGVLVQFEDRAGLGSFGDDLFIIQRPVAAVRMAENIDMPLSIWIMTLHSRSLA